MKKNNLHNDESVICNSDFLYSSMKERADFLNELLENKTVALTNAPSGHLKFSKRSNTYQFFIVDQNSKNGKYVRKSELASIHDYAQKEYDAKLISSINDELEKLNNCLLWHEKTDPDYLKNILSDIHPAKQHYIDPVIRKDDDFINAWLNEPFISNDYPFDNNNFFTGKGERVRSKSELIMADLLSACEIPYKYEQLLILSGIRIFPDFTCMNIKTRKVFYIEHFGRMDDPVYAEKAVKKLNLYAANGIYPGINLLVTFETLQTPLNTKTFSDMLQTFLANQH